MVAAPTSMTFTHYYLWGMHMFWWIFWLVAVGVLMYLTWPGRREAKRDLAREALRRRFVDGEITEDDYRQRLAVLNETEPGDREHAREARSGT